MLDLLVSVSASRYSLHMSAPLMTLAGYGPMPWEAAATIIGAGATLVTGILAVIAAVIVGVRQANIAIVQADIAERQTRILASQQETDYRRLQSELFDRRLNVFTRVMAFFDLIETSDRLILPADLNNYSSSVTELGLILSDELYRHLEDSAEIVFQCVKATNAYVSAMTSLTGDVTRQMAWLVAARSELPTVRAKVKLLFFAEMKLDIPPAPRGYQTDSA